MFRSTSVFLLVLCTATATAQERFPGVGRPAAQSEIRAWDIDVRADFSGLPKGSGSARQGERLWEAKCASCHGSFGESNSVSMPIAGGTTSKDIETGRVAALLKPDESLTTLMKLSQISTLWDYINRAMPWESPRTLSADEVYALCAYILFLGNVVPENLVLSEANIVAVQQLLPNRNGLTSTHGLWNVSGKPDVHNRACMKNCPATANVASQLPGAARASHGNMADQNRPIGGVRGIQMIDGK